MSFATISVIGLGYIGLPTAAAFASRQKQVIGVDINQHAVDTINRRAVLGVCFKKCRRWRFFTCVHDAS